VATNFPTSLDSLTNPTSSNSLASPDHAGQHANANDAIQALQAKVGVNSSAVTSSLDYKVGLIAGRNGIINGGFNVWQRGTSFSAVTPGAYTADRWTNSYGGVTSNITRDTDVPSKDFSYSFKFAAPSTFSTTEYVLRHWLEIQNVKRFVGKSVTLSFWIKSSKTSLKCRVSAYQSTGGTDTTSNLTVVASTWTKISFTSTAFSAITAWTGADNTSGCFVDIGFQDSQSYTSADFFMITGVQLEEGAVATPFEFEDAQVTLAKCQRYYYRTYCNSLLGAVRDTNLPYFTKQFPTSMRISGTFSSNYTTRAPALAPTAAGEIGFYGNGWYTGTGATSIGDDGGDTEQRSFYFTGWTGTAGQNLSLISSNYTWFAWSAEL
jgi:hypothetical protein